MRRTVSFPDDLDARVAKLAEEHGESVSGTVVRLVAAALSGGPLPYEGLGEGPGDLSTNTESYLHAALDERR